MNGNDGDGSDLAAQIAQSEREIAAIDEQIRTLQEAKMHIIEERRKLVAKQRAARVSLPTPSTSSSMLRTGISSTAASKQAAVVNYGDSSAFKWTARLRDTLLRVFGISELRLCQEGVLNAIMDGRDTICIMPTGGGKSVCFQAPAILSEGCTLVISPLISLSTDQVMHLRDKGE